MQRKQLFLFALCLSLAAHLYASIPSGYYNNASGKQGAALKTALASIITSGHSAQSYAGVWAAYQTTDIRSDGYIWDRYSSKTNYTYGSKGGEGGACGNYTAEGSCYNREHSWPKSWFGCSDPKASIPASTDLHQVVPTDGYVNNTRSAYIFGEVKTASKTYSNAKFGTGGYGSYQSYTVFEPADEYKGDFARIYFYMVTRYQDNLSSWSSSYSKTDVAKVIDGSTYPAFQTWYLEMLLAWAKADPVDEREIYRNDAVYAIQKNRNPFIDFPGLEDYIWGDHKTTNVDLTNYTNPYSDSSSTTVKTPSISPNGGSNTIGTNVSVTLSCSTSGATIYYTTNGSTPTSSSTKYTAAFNVTSASAGTVTVKAIAIKDGTSSSVASASFVFTESGSSGGSGSGDEYELITSTSDLTAGSKYLLVANNSGTYYAYTGVTSNWGTVVTVIPSSNIINLATDSNGSKVAPLTLGGKSGAWTFYDETNKYYLALTSASNAINTATDASETTAQWAVTVSSSLFQIQNVGTKDNSTNYVLRFNTATNSLKFRCYKTTNTSNVLYVQLYKQKSSSSSTTTVNAPTFSPAAGTYTAAQTVKITSTTSGATIRYTTDGTTPTATTGTTLSNGGTVSISSSCTLKAVAVLNGTASSVTSGTYTINIPQVATPTFSPTAGTYTAAQNVTISCSTSGATIYYTTDGTTPTTSSSVYSSAIAVSSTKTIKALAVKSGMTNSAVASATYTINIQQVATPTFSPDAGTYTAAQNVTISCSTSGATIYYTTDGTTPTTSSSVYSSAIAVSSTKTIKALAVKSGMTNSAVASATYTINIQQVATPTFSPPAGTYTAAQNVTISCSTSGATIYYTTDGTTPTTSSSVYSSAIAVSSTKTIKALAVKSGMTNSEVASATYTINSGSGSNTQLLYESFSGYTKSGDGNGIIDTDNENLDYNNWATFSRVYLGGGGCGKLGSTNYTGSMTTGTIALTGNATLTFKVRKYGSDTGKLNVTVTGATASGDTSVTPSSSSTWQDCTVNITGATGSITIQFATSAKRAYIDEIILVSSSSSVTPEAPTFSPDGGTYTSAQTVTISSTTSGATIYYTTDGNNPTTSSSSIANGGTVNITESCTLKAMARYNNTNSSVSSATYVINSGSSTPTTTRYVKITSTNDLTSGEKYLIVYEDGSLAFNGSLGNSTGNKLDSEGNGFEVTIVTSATPNYIEATDDIDAKSFTITYQTSAGTYWIKSASGYYIGNTQNKNYLEENNAETGYANAISFSDGNAVIKGSGSTATYLRYNNATTNGTRFRYYKSGQQPIALYKRVETTSETIAVPISAALYGTLYYGEKNLIVPEGITAYTYTYNASGVPVKSHTYASGDVIPAGTGVVLATSGAATYDFAVTSASGTTDASNYLRGSDTNATTTGGERYYKLSLNAAQEAGSIGWYWGANNGAAFTNGAHKAYLMMPASVASRSSAMGFPFSGETTGIDAIENEQQPTAASKAVYTLDGRKVNNAANLKKGIYIVNGKKVVVR